MTQKQFIQNTRALKAGLMKLIDEKIIKIAESGCLPLDEYENNYELPKAFLSAMGKEIEWQYRPLTKHLQSEAKNISKFI